MSYCNECPFTKTCQSAFGNAGGELKEDIKELVRKQVQDQILQLGKQFDRYLRGECELWA